MPITSRHVLVVGGGITGLAAAHRLVGHDPAPHVTLIESSDRLGGKLRTERVDGYVVDAGPESLAPGRPDAARLADELGVGLVPATTTASGAVRIGRRLRTMPDGIGGFLPRRIAPLATTRLFSPIGKVRMAFEVVVPARRDERDESLASFARRRLGTQAYHRLVEPVASGIFCADPERLSLLATMPHLKRAEREHGGLLRAVLSERRAAKAAAAAADRPTAAPPRRGLMSPPTGMGDLVDALVAELVSAGADLQVGSCVLGLERREERWHVVVEAAGTTHELEVDAVVLAVPNAVAADLSAMAGAPDAAATLRGIPVSSVTTVSLGYLADDLPPLDDLLPAHGYLVPGTEPGAVRQVTRSSAKFPGRAPEGHELFRVALRPGEPWDDDTLVAAARAELRETLGVDARPTLVHVQRWDDVMPQYPVGHLDLVARAERDLDSLPGVVLAGSGAHGLGIPDCVASAHRAADRVA